MFQTKYSVSILNSKWEIIESKLKLKVIPRQYELLYLNDKYLTVIKVIHMLNKTQDIFVVVEDLEDQPDKINLSDNQVVTNY